MRRGNRPEGTALPSTWHNNDDNLSDLKESQRDRRRESTGVGGIYPRCDAAGVEETTRRRRRSGRILIELETDKVSSRSCTAGWGAERNYQQNGEVVLSQEVLARIDTSAAAKKRSAAPEPAAESKQADAGDSSASLSPAVRKLVAEHDLDPGGHYRHRKGRRLTKGDVLKHLEQATAAPATTPPPVPRRPRPPRRHRRRRLANAANVGCR